MAQSQTNLTIGVGIDTSKFIADAAIVKDQLRNIKREVDAAARAGDVSALRAAAAQQDALTKQYSALSREIRGATQAKQAAIPVFNQMSAAMTLLHSKTVLITGVLSTVSYGFIKLADSAAKAVDKVQDVAEAVGVSNDELLARQLAGAEVGSTAEDVNQGLIRSTRAIGAERKERKAAQKEYEEQMKVRSEKLKDMTQEEQDALLERERRGLSKAPQLAESTGPFGELGIDVTKFAANAEGNAQILRAAAFALDDIKDASERADKAQGIFGKNWSKQIELIKAGKDGFAEQKKFIDDYGLQISKTAEDNSAAWLKSSARFAFVFDRMSEIVGNTIGASIVPILDNLTNLIAANQAVWTQWANVIAGAITTVRFAIELLWLGFRTLIGVVTGSTSELGKAADAFVASWDAAFAWFGNKVSTVLEWFNWIIDKGKEAASFLGLSGGAGGDGSVTVPVGAASGGYVSGPGTGTSDSILARLSNGEFVLNASSVRRLGVGFLHGLNQFAAGGLVGMPPIRFAEGGLAAAGGGGTPVHLHLGSHSFALAGQAGVVKALVSEAHSQQMRSAGVKPSWVAGRPGGR